MAMNGGPDARTSNTKDVIGRLAAHPYRVGDPMPAVGSKCLVSGAHCDVDSDQHRSYGWRKVIGYTDDNQFVCLQTHGCWPTVEQLTHCWFAEIPTPRSSDETFGVWQPIETAPKDGRTLLLGYFNSHGKWRSLHGQWFPEGSMDEWDGPDYTNPAGWYETSVENDDPPNCWATEPTHWHPTLRPPEKASAN